MSKKLMKTVREQDSRNVRDNNPRKSVQGNGTSSTIGKDEKIVKLHKSANDNVTNFKIKTTSVGASSIRPNQSNAGVTSKVLPVKVSHSKILQSAISSGSVDNKNKKIVTSTKKLSSNAAAINKTNINKLKKPIISDTNVMNTIHNVTISSPPQIRRQITTEIDYPLHDKELNDNIVQKNISQPINTNELPSSSTISSIERNNQQIEIPIQIKEAVAFEINFADETKKVNNHNENIGSITSKHSDESEYEYEADFESYESDFESTSSSKSNNSISSNGESDHNDGDAVSNHNNDTDSLELSNVNEKPLDSGNFHDVYLLQSTVVKDSNLSETTQNDSGFGLDSASTSINTELGKQPQSLTSTANYNVADDSNVLIRSAHTTNRKNRGVELLKKITLDFMTFDLFELKPISYDYYMKCYSDTKSVQSYTQTNDDSINQETQTVSQLMNSNWSQIPMYNYYNLNVVPEMSITSDTSINNQYENTYMNVLDTSLNVLNAKDYNPNVELSIEPINYDNLNLFIQMTSWTLMNIRNSRKTKENTYKKSILPFCTGYFSLDNHNCSIQKVYANPGLPNLLYTIHISFDKSEDCTQHLIYIWNILDSIKPIYILSSWSGINCIECNPVDKNIVIGGMADGTLSIWDLKESIYWHSNINGITCYLPSQIVKSKLPDDMKRLDLGAIVALKNVISDSADLDTHGSLEVCSLHEIGILTIWIILQFSNATCSDSDSHGIGDQNHKSPWTKLKIIQKSCIDLRGEVEKMNTVGFTGATDDNFEKTRFYFESNLFSDDVLKELQLTGQTTKDYCNITNLKFIDLEFCIDYMCMATNRNFLLICKKSLIKPMFKRIFISDDKSVQTTVIRSINGKLFIGLSNGSIISIRCSDTTDHLDLDKIFVCDNEQTLDLMKYDDISAKSCTIQNIIEDEKRVKHREKNNRKSSHEHFRQSTINQQYCSTIENVKIEVIDNRNSLFNNLSSLNYQLKKILLYDSVLFGCYDNLVKYCNLLNDSAESVIKLENIQDMTLLTGTSRATYLVIVFADDVQIHLIN